MIVAMDIKIVTCRRIEGMQLQRLDGGLMFSANSEDTITKSNLNLVWNEKLMLYVPTCYATAESGDHSKLISCTDSIESYDCFTSSHIFPLFIVQIIRLLHRV